MDMSNSPKAEATGHASTKLRPGDPHNRDMSNPGELWGFLLAAALLAALGAGFLVGGLAGVGMIMVGLVPVIYVVLLLITVGR